MRQAPFIDAALSRKVLTVGEYFRDRVHGGIAAVLRSYEPCFQEFQFLASSRGSSFRNKLRYDLGSLFGLLWRLATRPGIRIVHIHTAAGRSFPKHLVYAAAARLMGRKVVLHCHASRFRVWFGEQSPSRQRRILSRMRKLDRLVCLSQAWKDYFVSIGLPEDRVVVLNNITPEAPAGLPPRVRPPLRLLFLGEIGPRKGVFDLLEAMKGIPEGVMLDIGGNKMEEELRDAIRKGGLGDRVCFHGFVSGDQKRQLLSRAHVFVLPSYNEGLPIGILEAMSYGCAVISTPVGGIPEVVAQNGILVPPGDVDALREAILSVTRPGTAEQMGAVSLEKVKPFYPSSVMADLEKMYHSLL